MARNPPENKTHTEPRGNRFEVARVLERAILTGRFRPGDRLPEMHIAREMGVSQASVREALQELEGLGLVLKYPHRGSVVTQLSAEDLVHISQIRDALEPLACGLAAVHLSAAALRELQDCVDAMGTASDFEAFSEADVRFHRLIWRAQPNRFLERSLLTVCLPLFAFDLIRRHANPHVDFTRTIRQHQLIASALRSRDSDLVTRLMRRMVRQWLRQDLGDYSAIQDAERVAGTVEPPSLAFLSQTEFTIGLPITKDTAPKKKASG